MTPTLVPGEIPEKPEIEFFSMQTPTTTTTPTTTITTTPTTTTPTTKMLSENGGVEIVLNERKVYEVDWLEDSYKRVNSSTNN